jgi:hypothetical protein
VCVFDARATMLVLIVSHRVEALCRVLIRAKRLCSNNALM